MFGEGGSVEETGGDLVGVGAEELDRGNTSFEAGELDAGVFAGGDDAAHGVDGVTGVGASAFSDPGLILGVALSEG